MDMLKEFKEFALRGSVVDLAVGIIIGAAFSSIINSMVEDLIMPPIGLALGGVDFDNFYLTLKAGAPAGPYATLADAQAAGAVTVNYGLFINALVSFIIVSLVMFLLVRGINRMQRKQEEEETSTPETRDCPYCLSTIPIGATRCPHCTSQLD